MGSDDTPVNERGAVVVGRFAELEDALVDRVRELRAGDPLAPLAIVVGSAAVRTHVGDLLVRRLGAVANVAVVTLSRLAGDLRAGVGRGAPPVLAGTARERLVRGLVASRGDGRRPAYFGRAADRPHFAPALAGTFADLREARVAARSGWATVACGPQGGARAADLEWLYAEYCDELERRGLADRAALCLDAATAVGGGPPRRVLFYGFYDFNEAQEVLIAALAARGADLFVPVPRGSDGSGAPALAVAARAGLETRLLEPPARGDDLERAAAVWGTHRQARPLGLAGDGSLRVVSVADERAEAREAVRAVVEAVAAGAALYDCAVVAPHGGEVERLASALEAAGLPVACRRPERTPGSRLVARLVDCLVPAAGPPLARRAVVDLLGSAPLRSCLPASCDAALWLDEARRAGVVAGPGQWAERLGRRRRGLERRLSAFEEGVAEAELDDETAESAGRVGARLAAVRSLEPAAAALVAAWAALPSRAAWGEWADGLSALVGAVFDGDAAAAAGDVLGRLRALEILDEEVDLVEVVAVLRDQLTGATVPSGRAGRRGVAVLTPLELRGLRFHLVVVTGLAEGGFPARGRPDPILGDLERRRVNERLGTRLPLGGARDAESTLLFAFACEAARARVVLLAPRTDAATGRPRLPSRFLLRLAALAAGRPVGLDEYLEGRPLAPVWGHVGGAPAYRRGTGADVVWVDGRERDTAVLLALSGGRLPAAGHDYLCAVVGPAAARRLDAWRSGRSPEPGAWDGLLGDPAVAAVRARHPFSAEMHPTRLERYLGCPFAFLLRDLLGLDAPEDPDPGLDIDALEFGRLVHDILQRAYEAVIDGGLDRAGALDAVDAAWRECCAEAEQRGVTGAALAWAVRREVLRDDLREWVARDSVFDGDGRPGAVEWRFGESAGRPVAMALADGRRVRFAGRIDRIDETLWGARVIDYKTGRGTTERQRVKAGLSVQLPVYQAAVRQAYEAPPGRVSSAYRLVTRRGGFAELALPDDEETTAVRLGRLVEAAVGLIDEGVFARSTAGRCDYCDVAYACGLTAWARTRKREHAALGALVDLQTSGPGETRGGADA